LKVVRHIIVSSAETISAFNTEFEPVNLHHPTAAAAAGFFSSLSESDSDVYRRKSNLKAEVESSFTIFQVQVLSSRRFQLGFDRVNLHRPTEESAVRPLSGATAVGGGVARNFFDPFSTGKLAAAFNTAAKSRAAPAAKPTLV